MNLVVLCTNIPTTALSNYIMWMEHLHMKQTNIGCQRTCVYSELLWDYRFDLCPWNQLFCVLCRCTLLFCCCVLWTKQQERKCVTIECNKIKMRKNRKCFSVQIFKMCIMYNTKPFVYFPIPYNPRVKVHYD